MIRKILLDSGPLLSLLDREQDEYELCQQALESLQAEYTTTEAVITEATHFLRFAPGGRATCVEFILRMEITVFPCDERRLRRVAELLRKYEDVRMSFADAMLVALAEETGIDEVFTLDSHFHIYRIGGRRAFTVIPDLTA